MKRRTRSIALMLSLLLLSGVLPWYAAADEPPAIAAPDFSALAETGAQESIPGVVLLSEPVYYAEWIGTFHGRYAVYEDAVTGSLGVIDCDGHILWRITDPTVNMLEIHANGVVMAEQSDMGWQPYTVYGKRLCPENVYFGGASENSDWATGEARFLTGEVRRAGEPHPAGYFLVDADGHCIIAEELGLVYDGALPIRKNGKWGLCDLNESVLLPFRYDALSFVGRDVLLAKENGRWLLIDRSGSVRCTLPEETQEARSLAPFDACLQVKENGLWGLRDADGARLLDCRYFELELCNFALSNEAARWYYRGRILSDADGYGTEMHLLSEDGTFDLCYCSQTEGYVYPLIYPLTDELFAVRKDAWQVIDAQGEARTDEDYSAIGYKNGMLVLEQRSGPDSAQTYDIILCDTDMKELRRITGAGAHGFTDSTFVCEENGAVCFYALSDAALCSRQENTTYWWAYECFALVRREGKIAMTDAEGRLLTAFRYDGTDRASNGLCVLRRDGCYCLLSCCGEELLSDLTEPLRFSAADDSVYAAYRSGGRYGFLKLRRAGDPLFADVSAGDWFAASVDFCAKAGLVNGVGNDRFAPQTVMTRAMLVQVLYNLSGTDAPSYGFEDVPDGRWFSKAVNWAAANGIVNGTSATRFSPDAPVTREQMVTILRRYALRFGAAEPDEAALQGFTDVGKVSDFAIDAMGWAVSAGLITGKTGARLDPLGQATRAEIATVLMRFVNYMAQRGAA